MHPRLPRELADAISRLSITFLKGYGDGGGFLTTGRQTSSPSSRRGGGFGDLQAGQTNLSIWELYGGNPYRS